MKAIILAAGTGERMLPLTQDLPKPMLTINDKPILQYTLGLLRAHGITDIGMTTFYKKEKITDFFRDGRKLGVRLTFLDEPELLPSGRAVRQMIDFVDDYVLITNGDNLTDLDLTSTLSAHKNKGSDITLVTYPTGDNLSPDSQIFFDESGTLVRFEEKIGSLERAQIPLEKRFANTGIYLFNKSALEVIPENTQENLGELFPYLLGKGLKIGVQVIQEDTYYKEVGNMERFLQARKEIESGSVSLRIPMEEFPQIAPKITGGLKLEIGAGMKPTPGYLHQDVTSLPGVNLDFVCNPWEVPLERESISDIIALGVMEHLRYVEVEKTLIHFNKLLKRGGSFRFDVPDMQVWAKYLYNVTRGNGHKNPLRDEHVWATIYGWQRWPGDEHKSGWTRDSLISVTRNAGFKITGEGPDIFLKDGIYRGRFTRYGDAHIYLEATK